jgi:acetyl-CoA carboxylase, biotin carboxylase subunit
LNGNQLRKVLVANRGEIAVRILRACFDEGIAAVAVHSEADAASLAPRLADEAVCIGPADAARSYLSVDAILSAALVTGCDGLHPGYGFLSERPELAQACADAGIAFVGPSADTIRAGGDKVAARALARSVGVPVSAGSDAVQDGDEAARIAEETGYPVLLKAAAGGGGRGMMLVTAPGQFADAFQRASLEARQAFGDGRLYIERYVANARHVEVQILADAQGNVVHLHDRDCSIQRRYQKLVEEAPASAVPRQVRTELADAAVTLARALDYVGAATVEFLYDADRESFSFLEINTRVQVEHPVTEMVTGIDIVREQLRIAAGRPLSFRQDDIEPRGHALECRINAEDAARDFMPGPGRIETWVPPVGSALRVDTHCFPGYTVPANYDSLLAKLICHGPDREVAIDTMERALDRFTITGVPSTVGFHRGVLRHADFRWGRINTRWVEQVLLPTWTASAAANGAA